MNFELNLCAADQQPRHLKGKQILLYKLNLIEMSFGPSLNPSFGAKSWC